jgi:large subunit ribosomal protein L23
MALFNKKPTAKKAEVKTEKKEVKETKAVATVEATVTTGAKKQGGIDLTMVLIRPHITEKATDLSEHNVYAFEISKLANKAQVSQAIEKFYKVRPMKIAVVNTLAKYYKNPRTGRMQVKRHASKKALVYLKKGDKIEFV